MQTIRVQTSRPYDILVGRGLLDHAGELAREVNHGTRALIVTDSHVFPLFAGRVLRSFEAAGYAADVFVFEAGEEHKRLATLGDILERMAQAGITRADAVVAVGGGVTGDMAGLAAALYQRGIQVVQVPTSLLAMVDSSVGGKTAVDLEAGKNLAGAFLQPSLVVADIDCLATVSPELLRDSCGEMIKHGVLADEKLFDQLFEDPVCAPGFDPDKLVDIVARNVQIKRDVVDADEREHGRRQTLNLGHTIGHAAEKLGNYVDLTHGQAVAVGMVAAMRLSAMLGNEDLSERLIGILEHIGLPTELKYGREDIYRSLLSDKKKFGATVNFILVREPGRAEITPIGAEKLHEYVLKL